MPYKDPVKRKQKQAEYSKKYYENNKKKVIKKASEQRKLVTKQFAEYKSTKFCTKCGETHAAALDFHHVIHEEDNMKVHYLVANGYHWKRIMKEVAKCIVLCSNCHRKVHHEERLSRSDKTHK